MICFAIISQYILLHCDNKTMNNNKNNIIMNSYNIYDENHEATILYHAIARDEDQVMDLAKEAGIDKLEMNTTFEKSANSTDEWYTPKEIIDALGEFDLDPCAPVAPPYKTANVMYNKNDDGLKQEWKGRVWLNPPYSRPLIECFVKRMAEHGNGIALLFNRCDSKMFQDVIFEKATAMKFLRNRIRFFRPDGTRGDSPGCGSILIAFGEDNAEVIKTCDIAGKYVRIN